MSSLTIDRSDLTAKEVADILRARLGAGYNVLPGLRTSRKPLARPKPTSPDTVLVGRGSNRLFCAHVTVTRHAGHTEVEIVPGGLGWETAVNSIRLARRIRRTLAELSPAPTR